MEYKIIEESYKYFILNIPKNSVGRSFDFIGSVIYNEYLYAFGWDYDGIVSLNLRTGESEFLSVAECLKKTKLELGDKRGFFSKGNVIKGKKVYVPFSNTNALLQFDLETKDIEIIEVGTKGDSYQTISCDGDNIYLFPLDAKNSKIVKFNIITNREIGIDNYPAEIKGRERTFFMALNLKNKVLLVADRLKINTVLDYGTDQISIYPGFQSAANEDVIIYQVINNSIFYMNNELWGIWDCETQSNSVHYFTYDNKIKIKEYITKTRNHISDRTIIREEDSNALNCFIDILSSI